MNHGPLAPTPLWWSVLQQVWNEAHTQCWSLVFKCWHSAAGGRGPTFVLERTGEEGEEEGLVARPERTQRSAGPPPPPPPFPPIDGSTRS